MAANTKKPKIMVQNISCILPQESQLGALFLGNVYGAQNPTILKQYGIRAVLTSSIETDIQYNFKDVPFHMRISAHDKENYNIKQHINQCIQFIENSRKLTNVYVHCFAGVSRSAAIVCAYIMWKLKWNFETTIAFVKAKRIVANPNEGFVRQLMEIQNLLLGIIEDGSAVGYQDTVAGQVNNGYNSIKAAQVPLLLTQTLLKETQNKQTYDSHLNSFTNFNSTLPVSQFDRLSLQQHQSRQHSTINNYSLYDQQHLNSQYYVPTNQLNKQNQSQINSNKNSSGDLYYVDLQKIAKSRNSMQKISVDNNFEKTASSDSSIYNNKFAYLQNFFPQNHTVKNQSQKPKKRIDSTISSTLNSVDISGGHQKPGSVRKSLKKLQNTQVLNGAQIQKQSGTYYIPKTSSNSSNNNSHLILGGGKKPQTPMNSNHNHNLIPISKIKQKSVSKNTSQYQNLNLTMGQQQFYHTLSSGYNNRNSTDSYLNEYSSRTNGISGKINVNMNNTKDVVMMTSPRSGQPQNYLKYDQLQQKHNGLKSPTANSNSNHFINQKFDFRNSAPSDGFFTNTKTSQQKTDPNKSSSRLVKPKDLPGYKNY